MPSPIAHLGVGYAIYSCYKERLPQDARHLWKISLQLGLIAGLSLLPDLDVMPAILYRDMHTYHNNVSHSLFVGIPVALLVAALFYREYRTSFWLWFVICLLSYDFHIFMDALTAARGVMMFWPLTGARFASPVKIFYGLQWGLGWFSIWHLWTIFTETVFSLIVIFAVRYFAKKRIRQSNIIS
jgi:membrane-bound metal-dependent hydrolase YbcI (DUF457 family)